MKLDPILKLSTLLFLFALPGFSTAQTAYRVGSAESSLEPPESIFSLALAGYGAPREGRFSLEWIEHKTNQEHSSLTGLKQQLYKQLFRIDQLQGFELLFANEKEMIGMNKKNELFVSRVTAHQKWKLLGEFSGKIIALAVIDNELLIADGNGNLWKSPLAKPLSWVKLGPAKGIIDLAVNGDQLYALTTDQQLLRYQTNADWLRIAIHNGITYQQHIQQIAVSDGRLYGIDSSGVVYKAQHRTDNQLRANAISIRNGKQRVVIAGLDLCGFAGSFITEVKATLTKKYGVPPEAVLINASHTHFAPVSQNWSTWGPYCQKPDSSYLYGTVKPAIIAAIGNAIKSEAPANIRFGRGKTAIGVNRSLPETKAVYDQDVLEVTYKNNPEKDLLFLHGCHPVFSNQGEEGVTIGANFPAVARAQLNTQPHINRSLFIQGCAGDINPADADHKITGSKLASSVQEMLGGSGLKSISGAINYYLDSISFAVTPWTKEKLEAFKQQNSGQEGNVGAEKNVRWADLMLEQQRAGTMLKQMPVYVQTLNIGNWKLVGLSRETVTDYSIGIKNIWPGKMVSVAGYCNDVSSYLPSSKHIKAGTYEGNESFFWYGQPNTFPENVYEVIIDAVKTKNR